MFGAFKPSAPLSGGLLWKIPWRLSPPQKLRHRRRMRRVDNVVAVLDVALKRQAASAALPSSSTQSSAGNSSAASSSTPVRSSPTQNQQSRLSSTAPSPQHPRPNRSPRTGATLPISPQTHTLTAAEARREGTIKLIERWKVDMPTEPEMLPRDKYTMFDRKAKEYRKGVHKLPKWTRVSQRLNPPGF
ncbi:hypothetical protein LTR62_003842 [Meristemomyces frigidus]|uniref:54S ribosomal protein L31, mitochondrial n=1 Tax=Meristemomyces frigidus TaxID=1508187 RepID=A0AAN7TGP0_9PEZI|nr:hypothetical protein LTR62_003842 [Meristemomyces frigidus]